jgi:hypothetical protein
MFVRALAAVCTVLMIKTRRDAADAGRQPHDYH